MQYVSAVAGPVAVVIAAVIALVGARASHQLGQRQDGDHDELGRLRDQVEEMRQERDYWRRELEWCMEACAELRAQRDQP